MTRGKTDDFGPSGIASCEDNATDGKDLILREYVNGILMETNKGCYLASMRFGNVCLMFKKKIPLGSQSRLALCLSSGIFIEWRERRA